jgi:hypothetical protein
MQQPGCGEARGRALSVRLCPPSAAAAHCHATRSHSMLLVHAQRCCLVCLSALQRWVGQEAPGARRTECASVLAALTPDVRQPPVRPLKPGSSDGSHRVCDVIAEWVESSVSRAFCRWSTAILSLHHLAAWVQQGRTGALGPGGRALAWRGHALGEALRSRSPRTWAAAAQPGSEL